MHVLEEELELYVMGRLSTNQVSGVESHLTGCSSCAERLDEVVRFASEPPLGNPEGPERRREHRIPTDERVQMQSLSPFSSARTEVRVIEISRNGFKLRIKQALPCGAIIQIRTRITIILGEVRYCRANESEFDVGVVIQDVIQVPMGTLH